MNQIEAQLRSWAPRRPSARLNARIFSPAPGPVEPQPAIRISWLAPATAAVLLLTVLLGQRNSPALSSSTTSKPVVAMILSNQSAAAYLPGSFQHEQNIVTANTFEWTNRGASPSSVRSLSSPKAIRPRDE